VSVGRPVIPTVDAPTAAARLGEGAGGTPDGTTPLLVDVRERHEFVAVRVPGAALVPTSTFVARYRALPTDRPLLVICHSGSRSAAVTGFLLHNGYADVTNVAGGLDGWLRAGLAVRRGPLEAGEGELPGQP
jgi:rhodanese-related sulfurtransferase